jgi:threonine dehydrogenase-like Zn-dependent dehydrogenase
MKATVMHGARDVRIEEVEDAKLADPTDAVIRIARACICGSDLWPYASLDPSEGARIMGHEAIGIVEDIGTDVSTLKPGDVVVMPFASSDGSCIFCAKACRRRASTSASSAMAARWAWHRPKRCAFLTPTARSTR